MVMKLLEKVPVVVPQAVEPEGPSQASLRESLDASIRRVFQDPTLSMPESATFYQYYDSVAGRFTDSHGILIEIGEVREGVRIEISNEGDCGIGRLIVSPTDPDLDVLRLQYQRFVEMAIDEDRRKEYVKNVELVSSSLEQYWGTESVLTLSVEPGHLALTISMLDGRAITFELQAADNTVVPFLTALCGGSPWRRSDYLLNVATPTEFMLTRYQSDEDDEPMRSVRWKCRTDLVAVFSNRIQALLEYYIAFNEAVDTYQSLFKVGSRYRAVNHLLDDDF